jgi:predicted NBD/HSP70 family sugar kinase
MIRRRNRGLVLDVLRHKGPLSRTQIALSTGLSNASLSAIGADLVAQDVLVELDASDEDLKGRGRPAVLLGHNRHAAYVILIELDVTRCRLSLIDYAGTLVDRTEFAVTPTLFVEQRPADYLIERIGAIYGRNPDQADSIRLVSISVQGILDGAGTGLKWSPIAHLAHHDLLGPITDRFPIAATLYKRGRLMADGVHRLFPHAHDQRIASIFVGSTIGMGLSYPETHGTIADAATEFGHMNHIPDGALCRCGARGCIEAYAADYGVLRTAFSVPERTPPATAVPQASYRKLIEQARAGERDVIYAFNLAGRAIGYGINRLMSVFETHQIVLLGPGATAFDLMRTGIEEGTAASLIGQVNGPPTITILHDEGEPIFSGLMMKALSHIDQNHFAPRPGSDIRAIAQ